MNQKKVQAQVLEHAKRLTVLIDKITETSKNKNTNPTAWRIACDDFRSQYNMLAFPGGLDEGLAALKNHDLSAIMIAIEFLKADPYYHRSGYNKKKILHLLKNAPLEPQQINDLQDILVKSLKIKGPFYLEYCRLAYKIQDPNFRTKIEDIIAQSTDERQVRNARKMWRTMNL